MKGVLVDEGEVLADRVILATGHSARDVYRMLQARSVLMLTKEFAVGLRLEHPQEVIDRIQYHNPAGRGDFLPAAEYSFVTNIDGRGVYSFCMCPGGCCCSRLYGTRTTGSERNVFFGPKYGLGELCYCHFHWGRRVERVAVYRPFWRYGVSERFRISCLGRGRGKLVAPAQRLTFTL